MIAFGAGSELYFPDIKNLLRVIGHQAAAIFVTTVFIVTSTIMIVLPGLAFFHNYSIPCVGSAAFMLGTIMFARSPSSTLAIIGELKCRGPVTKICVAVTVVSDVILMVSYAISSSVAAIICGGTGVDALAIVAAVGSILGCFVCGYLLALVILFIMWVPLPKRSIPRLSKYIKRSQLRGLAIVGVGFGFFCFANWLEELSMEEFEGRRIAFEPLLA